MLNIAASGTRQLILNNRFHFRLSVNTRTFELRETGRHSSLISTDYAALIM